MMTLNRMKILGAGRLITMLMTVFLLSGCPWFNSDNEQEARETTIQQPVEQAPIASFSTSTNAGEFPLSVSFIDTSDAGSSEITTRLWDFGDGNTSDEQAPTHVYEQAGSYQVNLTVATAVGSDSYVLPLPVVVSPPKARLQLSIVDKNGVLLSDIDVSSARFTLEGAQANEQGLLVVAAPSTHDGVIRIKKAGYLDGLVFLEGMQGTLQRHVTMIKRAPPIKVNSFFGGRYTGHMGASVEIPGEALVKPDGSIVVGEVDLFITPLDTSDPLLVGAFPGSFYGAESGAASANEQGILLSYGVVDVTFELDGQPLQLREGMQAQLTLPVFSTKDIDGSDFTGESNMPVWFLDETTGIWAYESLGQIVEDKAAPNGLSVRATTSHFTRFNCDINPPLMYRTNSFSGSANGSGGRSSPDFVNVEVNIVGATIGQEYIYTNSIQVFGATSRRSRSFVYDGSNISFKTMRNINIGARVTSVLNSDIWAAQSTVAANDPTIITLDLEQAPLLYSSEIRVRPVLEYIDNQYTVEKNIVYIGAEFSGTDGALFSSESLSQPLILGSGLYHELEVTLANATNPMIFNVKAENQYGTVDRDLPAVLIGSLKPDTGITWGESDFESDTVKIKWQDVDGADSVDVFKVAANSNESFIVGYDLDVALNKSFEFELIGGLGEDDFLKLVFYNQYGESTLFLPVNKLCPPNSDLCVPAH